VPKQTGLRADDPYGGRQPTSHERHAGQPWDASYRDGPAPWDIGEPQPAVVRLASGGVFAGAVLDAGCGTGDNALHLATQGAQVLGVDVAVSAVSIASENAKARGIDAEFIVADALRLDRLGRVFDTVLDCALFHAFDNDERRDYVVSLASVTRPGGHLYVLCFSDSDPENAGPHPVSREELSAPFTQGSGWSIASISPERLQATFAPEAAPAWLATIERIDPHD
jgi:SAM-dependent methyltransferase